MSSPEPGTPTSQLADLYEAIEAVDGARKRFRGLDDQAAADLSGEMMKQLLSELHFRLGYLEIVSSDES